MKILEFITPSNIGGAENYLVNLSNRLKEKGHDIYILSSNPHNGKNQDLSVAEFFSKSGFPFKMINIGFKYSPVAILRVLYFSKKNNIELIHTNLSKANVIGAIVSKILGIKSVATAHGLNKKSQYKYSDCTICVSHAVSRHLITQGVDEKKLNVIYNGIDTGKFDPKAEGLQKRCLKEDIDDKKNKECAIFNIGMIARLSHEKGVSLFLDAACFLLNKIPEAKFFIAGTGVLKRELIKKADNLGIGNSVYFLGFVGDNLVSFINELDVVVFPSLKEGLPLSLIESMSMEKTVIVSDVGGMPEVVRDGKNGFVVKKRDIGGIYQKLIFIYNNGKIISNINKEARKTVIKRFNIDIMADKTEDLFKTILRDSEKL